MEFDPQDKSAHISSLNKTPASIIQEYAAKNNLTPQYALIFNGVSLSRVTFKFSLTLNNYVAVGEGFSKKEAKHVAALKVLNQMIEDNPLLLDTEFKQWDFKNHVVSPFDNNIRVNAVGQLNDICTNNKLGLPEFKLVREEGQAHAKLFTISCRVGKMVETAIHKTKKQAKHLAAVQMVDRLMSIDMPLLTDNEIPFVSDSVQVVEQVESLKTELVKKNAPMDEDICNYHMLFKKNEFSNTSTLIEVFKQYLLDGELKVNDPIGVLHKIVNECEMHLVMQFLNEDIFDTDKGFFCICFISNVYPIVYGVSIDNNLDMAKTKAAINLLTNICLLLK